MFKKIFFLLVVSCISFMAFADEVSVKAALLKKYQSLGSDTIVKKMPINGLYEVNLLGQEAYTNEKVEFLLIGGSLINTANLTDLTAERKPQFLRDFYKSLPLDKAIKTVYGKGKNELITFEDPDCPLCQAQHADWAKNSEAFNATVYTFLFPLNIHSDAQRKAQYILCQNDISASWKTWMESRKGLPLDAKGVLVAKEPICSVGVAALAASESLARSLGYHETPRFIFGNGMGASSVLSLQQFQDAFKVVDEGLLNLSKSAPVVIDVKKQK